MNRRTVTQLKKLFREKVKVVPGGPADKTRGVGMLAVLDALAENDDLPTNDAKSGQKFYRYRTRAEADQPGANGGTVLEELDYLTVCTFARVVVERYRDDPTDLAEQPHYQELVAVYDGTPEAKKGYRDGSFQGDLIGLTLIKLEDFRPPVDVSNIPQLDPARTDYPQFFVVQQSYAGKAALLATRNAGGPFPAPATAAGDNNWRPVAEPVAPAVFGQTLTLDEASGMDGDNVQLGRTYAITGPWNGDDAAQVVTTRGIGTDLRFDVSGTVEFDGVRQAVKNINVVAGTFELDTGGGASSYAELQGYPRQSKPLAAELNALSADTSAVSNRVTVLENNALPNVLGRQYQGGLQTYASNDLALALGTIGQYGQAILFGSPAFSRNATVPGGAYIAGQGIITDLAGRTLSFRDGSVFLDFVVQSGVLRCTTFGLNGQAPVFVGGLSAAVRHEAVAGSTVIFENRRVALNKSGGYIYAGGGTFLLRGTTPPPAAGDVEPGTTVTYEGGAGGGASGPWPTPATGLADDTANTFTVPIPLGGAFQNRELGYHVSLDTNPTGDPIALATTATINTSAIAYRDGDNVVVRVGNAAKPVGAVGVCVLRGAGRGQSTYSTNLTAFTATVATSLLQPVTGPGWYLHRQNAGAATVTAEDNDTVRIEITGGTGNNQVQFWNQEGGKLVNGQKYKLSVWAHADAPTTIACWSQSNVDYADLGLTTYFDLTDTYQKFEIEFTAKHLAGNSTDAIPDFLLGDKAGRTIWLSTLLITQVQ